MKIEGAYQYDSWWINNNSLYTSSVHTTQLRQYTQVTVRASDGSLFQDYVINIEWEPDPRSPTQEYAMPAEPTPYPEADGYAEAMVVNSNVL